MKKQKKVKIENFIGIYDNYIPDLDCDKAIKLFEAQNKMNKCLDRIQSEGSRPSAKKDKQYFMTSSDIEIWYESLKTMIFNFDIALSHYLTETDAKSHLGEIFYGTGKIQKTLPTEGYHTWHTEQGYLHDQLTRVLVYSVYLNDVEEGGETEFLHQSIRVKPKKGRLVIWPAGFPYVHRGNPPLKGEKYIFTSWMHNAKQY